MSSVEPIKEKYSKFIFSNDENSQFLERHTKRGEDIGI